MKRIISIILWFLSVVFIFTSISLFAKSDWSGIGMLGMGLSLLPYFHDFVKGKASIKKPWMLWTTLFLISFIVFGILAPEREPTSDSEKILAEYLDYLDEQEQDFRESLTSTDPASVVETKYLQLLEEYGERTATSINPFAQYVADQLSVDVTQLDYIQHVSGTMGVMNIVAVMDTSAPNVPNTLITLEWYHTLRAYDTEAIEDITEGHETSEDVANALVTAYADMYRRIYAEPALNSFKRNRIAEMLEVSTLNQDDLEMIMSYHIGVSRIIELFPGNYPNKQELINITSL